MQQDAGKERITSSDHKHRRKLEWSSGLKYTYALLCWVCGIESVMRATILGHGNARAGAAIPYIILLVICGIPYACLETAVGQYSGKGAVGIWDCCPILKGIGHCSIFSILLIKIFTEVFGARFLLYFRNSLTQVVTWANCDQSWNDENCLVFSSNSSITRISGASRRKCKDLCESSAEQFWRYQVQKEKSEYNFMPNYELCIFSFITSALVFLLNYDGIRSLERWLVYIVFVPTVQQAILVVVSLTDPGSYTGLMYMFEVKLSGLGSVDFWCLLFEQVVLTLGFGLGGLSSLGSQSPFRKPIYMRGVLLPLFNFVITVFYSFMIHGLLGTLSYHWDVPIEQTMMSNESTFFAKIPQAITYLPLVPQLWALLFFSNFYFMALRNLIMMEAIILQTLYYAYPKTMERAALWSAASCLLTFIICIGLFMPFCIEFVEQFVGILRRSNLMLANLQILGLMWCYGISNFVNDIHFMLGIRPSLFWQICWCTTPIIFLVVQVMSIQRHIITSNQLKNLFLRVLAHLFVAAPLLFTVVFAIMHRVKNKHVPWKDLFAPAPEWGPAHHSLVKSRQMFAAQSITKEYMYRQNILKDKFAEDDTEGALSYSQLEYVY